MKGTKTQPQEIGYMPTPLQRFGLAGFYLVLSVKALEESSTAPQGVCVKGSKCSSNKTGSLGLVQTRTWARKSTLSESEDMETVQSMQAQANASFEAWKEEFHASLGLGDMCGHFSWDFGMVCRNSDGSANNRGGCQSPLYWDDGMDPTKPVHAGLTPCEANKGWGKPAGGLGNEPGMSQQPGWKPCQPPTDPVEYQKAFAYQWKPPGENRTCVPICVNRAKKKSYRKVLGGALPMAIYDQGLRQGSASCKKPARNCNFNDHVRDAFYRSVGFGKSCTESFNTTVYDTCAKDPGWNKANCEVEKNGKKWNVLSTCWDGAWDTVCKANKCFGMMSQTDQKCVTTCKSYGAANYSKDDYDECSDAWAAAGCPADGVSFNKPDPCENSTEPPSAAETAAGTAVAPGTRDNTLGVRLPTTTTTTAEPEATTTTMAEPETTTTFTGTRVPCTTSCEKEFANCFHWHGKEKTPEEAYSQCRGEIDEAYWRLKDEGCIPFCLSTNSMCEGHKGCATKP